MKDKIRTTMNALLARQRELTDLRNADLGGLTKEQSVEFVRNNAELRRLAAKLA